MIPYEEVRRLRTWEEYVGVLTELVDDEHGSHARFGKNALALPKDMTDILRPHVGRKIAILRTDDQVRPYRFRIVGAKETKNSPAGAASTGRAHEHSAQDHRSEE